jgi:O-6-methylguanine DNA methyltransferase
MDQPAGQLHTPLGTLHATFRGNVLTTLSFTKTANHTITVALQSEIEQYFAGSLQQFQTPFAIQGSLFEQTVWQALLKIPYGETRSYEEIAITIGKPTAVRAVANAIGKNPLILLIPCHRVIRKNGTLGGYREEAYRKQWILQHEAMFRK